MKNERTFVMLKPDAVQRSLIGEVIRRFERAGLKLVGIKIVKADEDTLWMHYNKDDEWYESKGARIVENRKAAGMPVEKEAKEYGRDIIGALVKYMKAGPVVQMVWEGNQAVAVVMKLTGSTEPATSDVGTIRGDFTLDSYALSNLDERAVRNLVHCSDEPATAEREIGLWFKESELLSYRLIQEQILYDVNLDGILE
ncbi:MAG TPA: nucleoside-diphosphate kinase [Candidatus Paceibacterota bacterium]|nr:nucleoside-diphosphate kinase [Candidatus Paceibacterota bacterium]